MTDTFRKGQKVVWDWSGGTASGTIKDRYVRKVTRKRGVGRRILDEARRLAREAGKPLHLAAPRDHLESQALAARTGLPLDDL